MKDNINFCRKLFGKLIADSYDSINYFIILDYFSLKVLELLEHYDINRVNKYSILFKEFQAELKLSKHAKALEIEVFFFTLNNMLIDKYEFVESSERNEFIKDYVKNLMEIVKEDVILKDE